MDFLSGIFQTVLDAALTFGDGALVAATVLALTDLFCRVFPPLRPWREALNQFVLSKVEELRLQRAQAVVLSVGQQMKAEHQNLLADAQGIVSEETLERLKQQRNMEALAQIERIAGPGKARELLEGAVAGLKAQGVNP